MAAPMKKLVSGNLLRCNIFKGFTWSRFSYFYQQKQFVHSETYIFDNGQTDGKNTETHHEREIPLSKWELYQKVMLQPDQPPNAKILRVAIIGAPNAGKSTLMNQLTKWKVSAVSKKVNCTRKNTMSVLTKDDTQIVFLDTPGARSPGEKKRHYDRSMIIDPIRSMDEADLVTVLVDAENRWTRNQLNEHILKILHLYPHIPSILVLNKCDIVKNKEILLHVTDMLTQGVVDGQMINSRTAKKNKKARKKEERDKIKMIFDRYQNYLQNSQKKDKPHVDGRNWVYHKSEAEKSLKKESNEADIQACSDTEKMSSASNYKSWLNEHLTESINVQNVETESDSNDTNSLNSHNSGSDESLTEPQNELDTQSDSDVDEIGSNSDHQSESNKISENSQTDKKEDDNLESSDVDYGEYFKRLKTVSPTEAGWPNFRNVFMVSAIDGDGIDELENYLFSQAKPGNWEYHSSFVTDVGPYELARACVWEKLLDNLQHRLPYLLQPEIQEWDINADGTLCVFMQIETANDLEASLVIGRGGETVKRISMEAQQELMNTFRREVILNIQVKVQERKRKRKRWTN